MFTIVILFSFVLYLVIGLIVGRTVKSRSDYYVANRKAPTMLVAGTLVASFLSTVAFMGELGMSYDGYPAVLLIFIFINVCGYVPGVLLFGRYLRRSGAMTVPEFFGMRLNSPRVQRVAGITVVVGIGLYLIAVSQGLALLLSTLLDLSMGWSILIVWLAYTLFTFISGSKGILVNDTIMFFIFMVAGVVGMSYVIFAAGGPQAVVDKLSALASKPNGLGWHGLDGADNYMGTPAETLLWAVTIGLVWAVVVAVSPWQSSRYLMAKNEHVALRSAFVATACVLGIYVFILLGGFAINAFNPDIIPSEMAFIWAARNIMPTWLGAIAVTGVVAAGLSSASAFLALIAFSTANDVKSSIQQKRGHPQGGTGPGMDNPQRLPAAPRGGAEFGVSGADALVIEQEVSDESAGKGLKSTKVAMFLAGLVVLGFNYVAPPAILTIGYFAATLFATSWGPLAIMSVFSKKLTERGALAGMISGFIIVFVLKGAVEFGGLSLPIYMDPVILGFGGSLIAIMIGNVGRTPSPEALAFLERIKVLPAEERDAKQAAITNRIGIAAIAICLLAGVLLFNWYFVPLNA